MTFFGLKSGQDLENRAAHPYQEFSGVTPPPPPGKASCTQGGLSKLQINVNRQKVSWYRKSHYFGYFWLLKKLLNGKTSSRIVKNTLSRHSKTLQLVYI